MMHANRRPPALYFGLLLATVTLGFATRWCPSMFPLVAAQYGGDALWAAMVLWIAALVGPASTTRRLAVLALGIAVAVEVSQLYRAPWIDAVRATRAGGVALGQGFLWSDLVCYAVGVGLAAAVDAWLMHRTALRAPA
jgi:hypothetical protein